MAADCKRWPLIYRACDRWYPGDRLLSRTKEPEELLGRHNPLHAPLRQERAQGGRFDRFVKHLNAVRPGLFTHLRAPVRRNQDGCEAGTEASDAAPATTEVVA